MLDPFGYTTRRYWLAQFRIHCPSCATNQVQLTYYFAQPAEWKCRECRAEFKYEPDSRTHVSKSRPPKPKECEAGCPPKQVCDHCQWPPAGRDAPRS